MCSISGQSERLIQFKSSPSSSCPKSCRLSSSKLVSLEGSIEGRRDLARAKDIWPPRRIKVADENNGGGGSTSRANVRAQKSILSTLHMALKASHMGASLC